MTRRILLIAEAANPGWVSVPLVGWSLAAALREREDAHLVTQIRNRDAVLRAGLREGEDVTFIDSEALMRPAWKLGEKVGGSNGKGFTALQAVSALAYPYFERLVWQAFEQRLRGGEFALVHRVTPLSPAVPSLLARRLERIGVPFVLGPINGGVPWPKGYEAERRAEREWLAPLRPLHRLLPGHRATYASAAAVLAGSRVAAAGVPAPARERTIWLPENAVDPSRFPPKPPRAPGPLRAVFIGRLVACKGMEMGIAAAAPLIREGRMTLDIIGDGPLRAALEEEAARHGASDGITFHGWMPHAEVAATAGRADALLFPSIREFGGGVVLEAMAMGLAPLVVDYAGPAELVTEETGYKVPITPRETLIPALRAELTRMVEAPAEVAEKGRRARACVEEHYTWAAKAAFVSSVYDWALGERARPPAFTPAAEPRDAA
ncbi:glycosyltransferase family 4 protein [Pseudoroseicyclus tamaricis]|uniref:Glycosyltransferase n=1 Tax=Pseudoroseicyclus tamaricis TaxID=2705421 RepID=A0A6B2JZB5_9RHOB|nr:glycosyltransferase [Pseudoroseicyclus tamaricis]NDU99465.1 glycosyltransferase [Pseudoroseicyclus tamaricis]